MWYKKQEKKSARISILQIRPYCQKSLNMWITIIYTKMYTIKEFLNRILLVLLTVQKKFHKFSARNERRSFQVDVNKWHSLFYRKILQCYTENMWNILLPSWLLGVMPSTLLTSMSSLMSHSSSIHFLNIL